MIKFLSIYFLFLFALVNAGCRKDTAKASLKADLTIHTADSLSKSGKPELALKKLDSLLTPASEIPGDRLTLIRALLLRGNLLFGLKRYNEAYRAYYTARLHLAQLPKNCQQANLLFDFYATLANVSYGQNQFLDAVRQQRNAIATFNGCPPDGTQLNLIQGAWDNIGLAYYQAGKPDSALMAYWNALSLISRFKANAPEEKIQFSVAKGVVIGNLGTALIRLGDTSGAEKSYLESIALNGRPGFAPQDALITGMKLAELYVGRRQLDKASALLKEIELSRDTLPEPQDKLQLLLLKANYAKTNGQPTTALTFYEQYLKGLAELRRQKVRLLNTDYGREFELLENRYQLNDLQRSNQLQKIYLLAVLAICVLSGSILLIFLRNRKKSRLHTREIEFYNEQLQLTLEANEKLLGVVAHDLKNPLSAVQVLTLLLAEESVEGSEEQENLAMITAATQNMTAIIDDLLGHAEPGLPKAVNRFNLDLTLLLQECISLLRYRAEEKGQQINLTAPGPVWIYANRAKMWRVVNNLLVNAVKFSPGEGLITVTVATDQEQVTVVIKDEGIGMPAAMLAELFNERPENRRKGTAGEQSHGLGLAICRKIIEAKGGRIWAESEIGSGTSFYFTLPLVKAQSQ